MTALNRSTVCITLLLFSQFSLFARPANTEPDRILWNNQKLFLNGANVSYINFARDIGPGKTYFDQFEKMFGDVHAAGGNCMRLWLHTNGINTPEFEASGYVVGPGKNAIEDLQKILDLACENEIGLILCLWSFDMLRWELDEQIRQRNKCLLTDTSYTQAYIERALVPMVKSLKGHPALIAWEIFNEPEGMSEKFGWKHCDHVKIKDIQRVINQCAGAIRRADSEVLVTSGAWSVYSAVDRKDCTNFYMDNALIKAGKDPDGTLDFYSLHYYDWSGKQNSPFEKPAAYWQLDKPLVCAEFEMTESFGIPGEQKQMKLYENGYAGALGYAWGPVDDFSDPVTLAKALKPVYEADKQAVKVNMKSGYVTRFEANPKIIEAGQTSKLTWRTTPGTTVSLNGKVLSETTSITVTPTTTTVYTITAEETQQSRQTKVQVLQSGMIQTFDADVLRIGRKEPVVLSWTTTKGSQVTLNNQPVPEDGTQTVCPDQTTQYTLKARGQQNQTRTIRIEAADPTTVNRALNRPVTVSSSDTRPGTEKPGFLNDENSATRWASEYSPNQWVIIDLGKHYNIDRIILNWELASAKNYQIQLSNDASVWIDIYSTTKGDGGVDTLNNLQAAGRYVRLLMTERNTQYGYSLWEIEIYGIPVSTKETVSN